jgi:hypothetical protein
MLKRNLELWIAFLVILIITAGYLQVVTKNEVPAASGFLGHSLGVIGFILMLMTEILYSLRKRYQFARWGKLQHWLSFHIITGITGPYLVLLHSSWKFNGLAGILMLFTIMIVVSGFVGRYFYTALPRSAEGTVMEAEQVSRQIEIIEQDLANLKSSHPEIYQQAELHSEQKKIQPANPNLQSSHKEPGSDQIGHNRPEVFTELKELITRRGHLSRQLKNLDRSRRLLAIWHTFHVPLGAAMFLIAFIHVAATLYYATLLH